MNAWLNPSEDRKPRSEYGWKFWKWYIPTDADFEMVINISARLQQKHENWYVIVEELSWIEDSIDIVHERSWVQEAEKLVWLIKIAREQKKFSWFIQDLVDWINNEWSYSQWISFWILHSWSIDIILNYYRDEISHNLECASKINSLLPKNGD
jgi:hypothetical protein